MKCECKTCKGEGTVEVSCHDCDGEGRYFRCITTVDLEAIGRLDSSDLESLGRLQADAARCQDQAVRLPQMNPACADSYAQQLRATLAKLNQEADEFMSMI